MRPPVARDFAFRIGTVRETDGSGRPSGHTVALAAALLRCSPHRIELQEREPMTSTLTDQERIQMQRRTVAEHMDGENTHEYDRVNATFVQDERAYYQIAAGGVQFDGISGVRDFYELLDKVLPDLTWTVTHEYDVPGCCIREGTATGTHSFEFAGVPASGNFVSFEVCALYIFDEQEPDKLIAERAYWDNDALIKQLKGEQTPSLRLAETKVR
jgi:predicted ester cyclase